MGRDNPLNVYDENNQKLNGVSPKKLRMIPFSWLLRIVVQLLI